MFPLKQHLIAGYRHGQWTFYGSKHKGNDYRAHYVTLYAPFDGKIIGIPNEPLGGQWLQYRDNEGRVHHFAHMSSVKPMGVYKEGQVIGVTGNSGRLTTNSHLHYHVRINGVVTDPETLYKEGELTMSQYDELLAHINALRHDVNIHTNQLTALRNELKNDIDGTNKTMSSWNTDRQKAEQEQAKDIKEIKGMLSKIKPETHTIEEKEAIGFITKIINLFKKKG